MRYKRKKRTEKQGKRGEYVCEIKGKKHMIYKGIISRSFSLESGMGIFRKAAAFMLLSYLSTQHRWLHHPEQTNDLS